MNSDRITYEGKLLICRYCKSYVNGKCHDYLDYGVKYPCVNYIERKATAHDDRRNDNQRKCV